MLRQVLKNQDSNPALPGFLMPLTLSIIFSKSTENDGISIPQSEALLTIWVSLALAIRVFVGVQPQLTQIPTVLSDSITAFF